MPCLTCHWVHGKARLKPGSERFGGCEDVHDSLAFFDRRERMHFAAAELEFRRVYDGARRVR